MTAPLAGITRVHGTAVPQTLTGGYQFKFFTVASTTTNFSTSYATVDSAFEKAVRAIENVSTIVLLGTPTAAGFSVAIDGGDYYGRDDKTGYVDNSITTLTAAITASGATNVVVAAKTLSGVGLA